MENNTFTPLTTDEILERAYHSEVEKHVLEVGMNKEFTQIIDAIKAAENGDEIKIYPGLYNEAFDCEKNLTFTGVPENTEAFNTFPKIYGHGENVTSFLGKCVVKNIIFLENENLSEDDLQKLCSGKRLSEKEMQKYRRPENENDHSELFCVGVVNTTYFKNCFFIGARNSGVVVDLDRCNGNPVFNNCGFFLNYNTGVSVGCKKSTSTAEFDNCKFSFNGFGIFGGSFNLENSELHHNFSAAVLFNRNESNLLNCDVYRNGSGISGTDNGFLTIEKSDIHTNYGEGIDLTKSSKIELNKCSVHMNKDAVILSEKSNFMGKDSEIDSNGGDAFLCLDNSELSLENCCIKENEEKGIEAQEKSKVTVKNCKIFSNHDDGIFAKETVSVKVENTDATENRTALHLKGKSDAEIVNCNFKKSGDCELFVTENSKCKVEKSVLETKEFSGKHKKYEKAVAAMCSDKAKVQFSECRLTSDKTKDTNLAMLIGETCADFINCKFTNAENGIVVYEKSKCTVNNSKFGDILNFDILQKSKLTSVLNVQNTKLSEKTLKDLSLTEKEILRKILPKLSPKEQEIVSFYYNLEEIPEYKSRLTIEETSLYFNISGRRVRNVLEKAAKLAEEEN